MLKMLKVFWGIDPPPPHQKMLKAGEMLKMLKISRNIFLKVLKTGEMLKMLKVFWGIDPPPLKKRGGDPLENF